MVEQWIDIPIAAKYAEIMRQTHLDNPYFVSAYYKLVGETKYLALVSKNDRKGSKEHVAYYPVRPEDYDG